MVKVIGIRPTPEQDYFLDAIRGELSKGEAIKQILEWLRGYGYQYVKNAGILHQPEAITSSSPT